MSAALCELLNTLGAAPAMVIGHSAGAALMLRLALDCRIAPKGLVSVNGALRPTGGAAARWLSPLTRMLFLNRLLPRLLAWRGGDRALVERVIRSTGSTLDPTGIEHYRVLAGNADHVGAALAMLAHWDLQPLVRDMGLLDVPLLLVAGSSDKAIKSEDAFTVRTMAPGARVEILRGLGHLAHEEAPQPVADLVLDFAREVGVLER